MGTPSLFSSPFRCTDPGDRGRLIVKHGVSSVRMGLVRARWALGSGLPAAGSSPPPGWKSPPLLESVLFPTCSDDSDEADLDAKPRTALSGRPEASDATKRSLRISGIQDAPSRPAPAAVMEPEAKPGAWVPLQWSARQLFHRSLTRCRATGHTAVTELNQEACPARENQLGRVSPSSQTRQENTVWMIPF